MNNNPSSPRPEDQEELVSADDSLVGQAFRRSLAFLLALVVLGTAGWWIFRPKPRATPAQVTKLSTPVSPNRTVPEVPLTPFTDVTAEAGVRFVHYNGAEGEKLLPETMGGGVAFLDFDND